MTIQTNYRYDYSRCMVMKLGMAYPEPKIAGKSHVLMTFEEALSYIRQIDAITQGITKIYYLVGWQYLGHDDKYPDFFEVNEALKRPQDKTAAESFRWLCEEGKKYNSVISVHINFNDAYTNAPSFNDFVKAGALIRKRNGKPDPIEKYNGRACYKTCHKGYWESGLFKRQFDRFAETFPFIIEAGTIHVDNFQCYKNYAPDVTIRQMQEARSKMIAYVREKGVDITSEFTYKESDVLPNHPVFGLPRDHFKSSPMVTLGEIPMSWWCHRMTRQELVEVPPQVYCGGMFREKHFAKYLYGNMQAEDIVKKDNPNWAQDFVHQFATVQVPFHFLCTHKRLAITGHGRRERCIYSDGIVSYKDKQKITQNGAVLKEKDNVFLPLIQKENTWIAYSKDGGRFTWKVPSDAVSSAKISQITTNGNVYLKELPLHGREITLELTPGQALLVCFS